MLAHRTDAAELESLQERSSHKALNALFSDQIFEFLSLSEFIITDTELKLIASAAIIGLSNIPVSGYKIPAASGIPSTL